MQAQQDPEKATKTALWANLASKQPEQGQCGATQKVSRWRIHVLVVIEIVLCV